MVPASALIFRDNEVQVGDPRRRQSCPSSRRCRSRATSGSKVEITGGLSEDERVVVQPSRLDRDGEEVRIWTLTTKSRRPPAGQPGAQGEPAKHARELAADGAGPR